MQAVEHFLFFGGQVGYHTMEKERRFVEQAFGRFDALDDDATRERVQSRVFFRRQILACKNDDRQITGRSIAQALENFEASHVGQPQVEDHAIERTFGHGIQRVHAGCRDQDVDIVVAEKFADAELLCGIILDDEQALETRDGVVLDLTEGEFEALGRRRLGDEREGAARKPVLAILVHSQHLHRNVARGRILFQVIQDRPAEHVGQEDVERDRTRMEFACERERFGSA